MRWQNPPMLQDPSAFHFTIIRHSLEQPMKQFLIASALISGRLYRPVMVEGKIIHKNDGTGQALHDQESRILSSSLVFE